MQVSVFLCANMQTWKSLTPLKTLVISFLNLHIDTTAPSLSGSPVTYSNYMFPEGVSSHKALLTI